MAYQPRCRLQLLNSTETETARQPRSSHGPQLSEAVAHYTLQPLTDFPLSCQLQLPTSPETETACQVSTFSLDTCLCTAPQALSDVFVLFCPVQGLCKLSEPRHTVRCNPKRTTIHAV